MARFCSLCERNGGGTQPLFLPLEIDQFPTTYHLQGFTNISNVNLINHLNVTRISHATANFTAPFLTALLKPPMATCGSFFGDSNVQSKANYTLINSMDKSNVFKDGNYGCEEGASNVLSIYMRLRLGEREGMLWHLH